MKKAFAILLAWLLCMGTAPAEGTAASVQVVPEEVRFDASALPDGEFRVGLADMDRVETGGYFTLRLYSQDLYDAGKIRHLKAGDTVTVYGQVFTVEGIVVHGMVDKDSSGEFHVSYTYVPENGGSQAFRESLGMDGNEANVPESFVLDSYEIYPAEEFFGYIAFEPVSDSAFRAVMNDWTPCTFLGSVRIMLPLPDRFVYHDGVDEEPMDADAFVEYADEFWFSPYNTRARFEQGVLTEVWHSDYPSGPEDE